MFLFEFLSEFAWAIFPTFLWYLSKNIQAMRFLLGKKSHEKQISKSYLQLFPPLLVPAVPKYPDTVLKQIGEDFDE